jgi:hypothetical protein
MTLGGRLILQLAPVVADGPFLATYPNVRPGPHVLLTASEVRRPARTGWIGRRSESVPRVDGPSPKPGMDLGALQELIASCGGHLWMAAESSGDMELRIRLPQPAVGEAVAAASAAAARTGPAAAVARWFALPR